MDQQGKLMEAMHQCVKLLHRSFHMARMQGAPVHHGQGRLLNELYTHDGAALKELVELLDIRPSSAGELVGKLEQAGYAERRQDEGDKRVIRVYLTQSGREQAQTLAASKQAVMCGAFSGLLEDEQAQLFVLLEKLNASLKQRHGMETDEACMSRGHGPHRHGGPHGHHGCHGGHGCHGRDHGHNTNSHHFDSIKEN